MYCGRKGERPHSAGFCSLLFCSLLMRRAPPCNRIGNRKRSAQEVGPAVRKLERPGGRSEPQELAGFNTEWEEAKWQVEGPEMLARPLCRVH